MVTLLDSDQGQGLGFSFHFSKEFWANVVTCCDEYFGNIRFLSSCSSIYGSEVIRREQDNTRKRNNVILISSEILQNYLKIFDYS